MNFIAHLHLSGTNEGLMVGNFIADAVKGKSQLLEYPDNIQKGIVLHRKIDSFTDSHPVFRESKSILVPKYNHFSGVLIDIFYDHFLTRNWAKYSNEDLDQFSERCMEVLKRNWEFIPDKMKLFYDYNKRNNRITGYKDISTISRVLVGMNRRTGLVSGMDKAITDLELHFDKLEKQFKTFFPELIIYVKAETTLL